MYKKGPKDLLTNYRPISLLCLVSKLLEQIVFSRIRGYLLNIISECLHGIIPGKCCTTQLIQTVDEIGSHLDQEKHTDVQGQSLEKNWKFGKKR